MWHIYVTGPARKQLRKIPQKETNRILEIFEAMGENPFVGDLVKLSGSSWRRRTGSYRIIFGAVTEEKTIYILGIKRRGTNTY